MKTTHTGRLMAAALLGALAFTNAHVQNFSSEELQRRTVERRAVWTGAAGACFASSVVR